MTKYLSIYKVQQGTICYIILCNTLYKINNFLIAKIKAKFFLIESISKKESIYKHL